MILSGEKMEVQIIEIPTVHLEWSEWYNWKEIEMSVRNGGINIPSLKGVYEVKTRDTDEILTIGKASNLRNRIKRGLVQGKSSHSSGIKIRKHEDTERIQIRWALTNIPSAVEENLHHKYREQNSGNLPRYTIIT